LRNLTASTPGALAVGSVGTAEAFAGSAQECPQSNGPSVSLLQHEADCLWVRVTAGATEYGENSAYTGYEFTEVTQQIGGQKEVAPGWFVGGSFGVQENRLRTSGGVETGDGSAPLLALAVKRQVGAWEFAGALVGGVESMDSTRNIAEPNVPALAKSSPTTDFVLGRARASYQIDRGEWFVRPSMALDVMEIHTDSFAESGAGALDLSFASVSHTVAAVTPAVDFGGRLNRPGMTLWPFLSLGVTATSASSLSSTATLLGQPIALKTPLPDVVGHAGVGLDVLRNDRLDLKAELGLDVATHYTAETGQLRIGYQF
jgi:outer membrane autotransporter protein